MENRRITRLISLILTLAMLLSMVVVGGVTASANETVPEIWDGWTTTAPADSDLDGVYEINNGAELAYAVKYGGQGKSYVLTADIYLNDITKVNWETGVAEAGYTPNAWFLDWGGNIPDFTGSIDGNYHTVYGLYFEENPTTYELYHTATALIPCVAEGSTVSVCNLAVDYAYLHSANVVSGIVGVSLAGSTVKLDSCYVGANVTLRGAAAGALYGYGRNAAGGSINNCYSLANTITEQGRKGLAAFLWNGANAMIITNCYNANGPITTFPESYYYVDAKNNYVTEQGDLTEGVVAVLSASQMQGENALENMSALNAYGNFYVTTDTYPTLSVFKGIKVTEVWNGTTSKPTQIDEKGNILINNAKELAYIISTGGAAGANYKLTSDIYLNKTDKINWETGEALDGYVPNEWYTFSNGTGFQGTIDGAGHVVYGLYYAPVAESKWGFEGRGLIPRVNADTTATIKKLGIDKAFVSATNGGGAFVGFAGTQSASTIATVNIDQCYVGQEAVINGFAAGAMVGGGYNCDIFVNNSYSLGKVNSVEKAGVAVDFAPSGFLGNNWSTDIFVNNCFNAEGTFYGWWDNNIAAGSGNNYATGYNIVKETGPEAYYATMIDKANMQGPDVFTNNDKMPKLNSNGKFVATEGYPMLITFLGYDIEVGEEVWDGTTSEPTQTDEDGNILISTAEELAHIVSTGGAAGANYKLTSDIYLNATDYINWETGEVTLGYTPNSWYYNTLFQGNIDGNGYTVYGLYYNVPGATGWGYQGIGLIPHVNSGASVTIKNLAVDKAYISSVNGASAFVGFVGPTYHNEEAVEASATIENCYAGKDVTIIAHHAGIFRGGTYRAKTVIKNCYTLATAYSPSVDNDVAEGGAGIFGNEWGSTTTLRNVFNANGGVGGQEASLANKTFTNVYVTSGLAGNNKAYPYAAFVILSAENMKGRDALENSRKLYNLNADNAFEATNGYPILVAFIKDVIDAPVTETEKIWNGTDVEPTKVDADGNILITSAEELAYIIENGGAADATYKLTTNIYLNDVNKINWATGEAIGGYVPNSWYENMAFQGTIDGNGYIVYGLYSNVKDDFAWGYWGQGLIPRVDSGTTATVKNLGVDKAYINGTNTASAFVGFAGPRNSTAPEEIATVIIEQCFAGEKVTLNSHSAAAFVGAGRKCVVDVKNSYSLADINSNEKANTATFAPSGFVGNDWDVTFTVNNSFNANGTLQGWWDGTTYSGSKNNYASGYDIDKTASGGTLEAYYATMLDNANMKGLDALTSGEKMWKLGESGSFVATESYPELKVFVQKGNSTAFRIWDGTTMEPTNGSGTEEDPFIISYASELAYIISTGGAANTYYKLANDIYLNNIYMIDWATGKAADGYTPNSWYENKAFQGNIDGNGFVIYGLYYNDGKDLIDFGYYYNCGLIPRVNDGTSVSIKNLGVDNAFVHAAHGASAFVGFAGVTGNYSPEAKAQVTIDNCYAGAKVYLEGGSTGVFRGSGRGDNITVTNAYSLANTMGAKYDGLIGNFWSSSATFTNVYNANGPVTTQSSSGTVANNVYATSNEQNINNVVVLEKAQMFGMSGLDNMLGLDSDVFTEVHDYYPVLTKFAQKTLVKNNRLYYGVSLTDALDYYTTASGEQYFWRYDDILVNDDNSMDIADLVFLTLQYNAGTALADIDGDGASTTDDVKVLRKALMGRNDYVYTPMYSAGAYTPYTNLSSDYVFVWGDEFDGDSLNNQKWGIYSKMEGSSGDHEGEFVLSKDTDAIDVENGNLRLTAYKNADGVYVAPVSVVTQNTMNFQYGYVEIRAKFPVQEGVWSSWWTKSVFDQSDTNNLIKSSTEVGAEVDMIEVFDVDQATFNIIKWWPQEDGKFEDWYPNAAPSAFKQTITNDRYYVFGYEWTEDGKVKMYCDGVLYGEYDVSEPYTEKIPGRNHYIDESGTNMDCFKVHQYLIFNNHLFYPTVSNAGTFITENLDFTSADYLIDYCRVYQKPGVGDIVTK